MLLLFALLLLLLVAAVVLVLVVVVIFDNVKVYKDYEAPADLLLGGDPRHGPCTNALIAELEDDDPSIIFSLFFQIFFVSGFFYVTTGGRPLFSVATGTIRIKVSERINKTRKQAKTEYCF